jgi:16S rRNA (cytosine1402-N4)-methyltransferase
MEFEFKHIPVLLNECIEGLDIKPDGIYADGTAGGAGHSAEIARRLTTGRLIALDKDPAAVKTAQTRLAGLPATIIQSDFRDMPAALGQLGITAVDGILLDLGVSSFQLDNPERGFSYSQNAPLDMRMSGEGRTAGELLNQESAEELARIFRIYGEEKFARKIALAIEKAREKKPLETTLELAELIKAAIPAAARREGGNPSKRVFQAVRIAVNGELDSLESILRETAKLLNPSGRFAVISFHSLEDRIVKRAFQALTAGCVCPPDFPVCVCGRTPLCKAVNEKPITAGEEELAQNPRSKPAKLRIIEKI